MWVLLVQIPYFAFCRDNILVLDVFFEALNYETIEQKKAYEVAGLLGRFFLSATFDFPKLDPICVSHSHARFVIIYWLRGND